MNLRAERIKATTTKMTCKDKGGDGRKTRAPGARVFHVWKIRKKRLDYPSHRHTAAPLFVLISSTSFFMGNLNTGEKHPGSGGGSKNDDDPNQGKNMQEEGTGPEGVGREDHNPLHGPERTIHEEIKT